jgi:tetratricopeptide (TPR) repeat protein
MNSMPSPADQAMLQLVVTLANSGDMDAAASKTAGILDRTTACGAWLAISRANANMQRWDAAERALENASRLGADSAAIQVELALLAERRGRHAEALDILESVARDGMRSPQWLVHLARALHIAGRDDEAEARLEAGLERWPVDVALHAQLAQLRWRRGAGEALTGRLERAIADHPGEMPLRLVAADHLRHAGFPERALKLLEEGLAAAPGSATFMTSIGVVLDDLGRADDALRLLRAAVAQAPHSTSARRNLVPKLLQVGEPREALRLLEGLCTAAPDDQQLIAWRATALRLAADPGYAWLHDYPRLVRVYDLAPHSRYADITQFNAALARELEPLHRSQERPLTQSLRGGSQTETNLPADSLTNPAIAAFFEMLDAPIRDYISRLDPRSDHPTDRRRRDGYRFAGSWSVQLRPGGFHTNHVHPMGWISSAYYVEMPANAGGENRAGWLKLGEPGLRDPPCAADHFVEPRPGLLVLFPSYVWHGTVPFTEGGRRLTAVFDAVPV